jgi:hypothetical protein
VSVDRTCQSRFICEADHYRHIVSSVQGLIKIKAAKGCNLAKWKTGNQPKINQRNRRASVMPH